MSNVTTLCQAIAISTDKPCQNLISKGKYCSDHQSPSSRKSSGKVAEKPEMGPVGDTQPKSSRDISMRDTLSKLRKECWGITPDDDLTPRQMTFYDMLAPLSLGYTPFLVGPVGTGKSAGAAQLAQALDADFVSLSLATIQDATLLAGQPMATKTGDGKPVISELLPEWAASAMDSGNLTLVFIDEITAGTNQEKKAALQLINERTLCGHELPPSVMFLAAGNLEEHSSHVTGDIPAALLNRFGGVFPIPRSRPKEWGSYERLKHDDLPFDDPFHEWVVVMAEYGTIQPEFFDSASEVNKTLDADGNQISSPRSISMTAETLAVHDRASNKAMSEDAMRNLTPLLGDHWGPALALHISELDLEDPEDWLANPDIATANFKMGGRDDAKAQITLNRMVTAVKNVPEHIADPEKYRKKRTQAAFEITCNFADKGAASLAYAAVSELISDPKLKEYADSVTTKRISISFKELIGDLMKIKLDKPR